MVDAALKTSFDWAASYDLWFTDIRISGKANAKLLDLDMTKSVALGGFEFKLVEAQLVLKNVTASSSIFEKSKNVRYFLEEGTYFSESERENLQTEPPAQDKLMQRCMCIKYCLLTLFRLVDTCTVQVYQSQGSWS
jgi:hypothetical protein